MSSLKDIVELGKQFGYEGETLRKFVQEELARERDQRFKERDVERDKTEMQIAFEREKLELEREKIVFKGKKIELKKQASIEKIDLEQQASRERIELEKQAEKETIGLVRDAERERIEQVRELEERKLEGDKQSKLETIELENINMEKEHKRKCELLEATKDGQQDSKFKGPKLPNSDDNEDNLDSYLHTFELYATIQKWQGDNCSLILSALLKGQALDVFSRLPVNDALNNDTLKEALLKRYELTEQGFRKKFKSSKPKKVTFAQFICRTGNYFQWWIECGKVQKTFEGLTDFLLRDQLLDIWGR
ncbi:hypothetical protein ACJMK2_001609 [Sinanodonta woodiana]|uniref:Uncharacterized protein n=1 Tax=Sinanodonta woodiana TaxID=1069815 RepID=A0ABD3XSQ7_SINWO